jgi:hypothetical protein
MYKFSNHLKKFASIIILISLISGALTATTTVSFASSATKQNPNKKAKIIEANDLRFELQNCERQSTRITCSFLVTNLGIDGDVVIHSSSSCFDYGGGRYNAISTQLAQEKSSTVRVRLLSGIIAKASVSFAIPPDITNLAALEIGYGFPGNPSLQRIMFRDLDIEYAE